MQGSQDGWFRNSRGNLCKVYGGRAPAADKGASFPTPMVISDTLPMLQSMADGKYYDSKSALYKTYKADGNPQGVEYTVVGNDQKPHEAKGGNVKSKAERAQSRRDSIEKAEALISRGEGVQIPE